MCHTLWHRLDLDFVSDDSDTGRLSAYTGGPSLTVDRQARASLRSKSRGSRPVPRRYFDLHDLPEPMAKIADLGDVMSTFQLALPP
jgi:hypothetical protein